MAATIERYAAEGVFDPPLYSQAVKVTGARTILFVSGQVAYDADGQPAHPGDFPAQARAVFGAIKAQVEGTFEGGYLIFDLARDGVGYSTSGGFIDDIVPQLEELKQQIIDGGITVPTS